MLDTITASTERALLERRRRPCKPRFKVHAISKGTHRLPLATFPFARARANYHGRQLPLLIRRGGVLHVVCAARALFRGRAQLERSFPEGVISRSDC